MEATRQAELSFLTWLREDWLIRQDEKKAWRNRSNITLTNHSGVYYADGYYNWVYYVPPSVSGVNYPPVIRDDNGVISSSYYSINYLYGRVTFSGYTPTGTVRADFATLNYTIRLTGESIEDYNKLMLPYIFVDSVSSDPEPLQIGGGTLLPIRFRVQIREYQRENPYHAEPFAKEIADIIVRGLTDDMIPIIDFSTYFPLSRSGNRVASYDRAAQTIGYYTVDTRPGAIRNFPIRAGVDPIWVSRREIDFTLITTR